MKAFRLQSWVPWVLEHLCFVLFFVRFAEQTTKLTIRHVSSSLPNATWRAQREATNFIWTTLARANVIYSGCVVQEGSFKELFSGETFNRLLPLAVILPCVDNELVQFPLRMRDWLKNVLLQLYEHDSSRPGFLTSKQRFRVRHKTCKRRVRTLE